MISTANFSLGIYVKLTKEKTNQLVCQSPGERRYHQIFYTGINKHKMHYLKQTCFYTHTQRYVYILYACMQLKKLVFFKCVYKVWGLFMTHSLNFNYLSMIITLASTAQHHAIFSKCVLCTCHWKQICVNKNT